MKPLVVTIKEKCRMCYTCVRDCPAKAIRVKNGQAEIVLERCIGCGHCILVCSQKAKKFLETTDEVKEILRSNSRKVALIAPSFPAAFIVDDYRRFVGAVRKLGFDHVCEVGFGADLVAFRYRELVSENRTRCYIATTCPAVVSFVEKYHPDLIPLLAPVATPMIASARLARMQFGKDCRIVFIGPCIAKKSEALKYKTIGDGPVDSVITFIELRKLFRESGIDLHSEQKSNFDPPRPGLGAVFPLSGGMLQATDMRVNLLNSKILMADGQDAFVNALNEFERGGSFNANLLETLSCKGCIMGAGMGVETPYFERRTCVSNYVNTIYNEMTSDDNLELYHKFLENGLDLSAVPFTVDESFSSPSGNEIEAILERMGKLDPEDELNCRACGYFTCRELAAAVYMGLAEIEMCLPYTIERLKKSIEDLNVSNEKLEKTREALFNAEKLALMGQLSAGIAHEINNPLGVILLNAGMLSESLSNKPGYEEYKEDLDLIMEQGERCRNIVSGLLNFARKNNIVREKTDVRQIVENCLKSIIRPENIKVVVRTDFHDPVADIDGGKIIQVLVNLVSNSIDAMPEGGTITITACDAGDEIIIRVRDTGCGIEKKNIDKIFEPLFTTKKAGKGTGLGLSVTYGIIKMHRGNINVISNTNPEAGEKGTEFTVTLPRNGEPSN